MPSITAVLPAYNEAAIIGDTIRAVAQALRENDITAWEIVVVDDGSRDGTGKRAEEVAKADGIALRVVYHEENRGYGGALRSGFDAAAFDAIWFMDSDGQFHASDLRKLLPHYGDKVAVFGYRIRRSDPAIRRLNHNAFFTLVRILCGPTSKDVNCAFKLFPRTLGQGLHAEGAMISTELVLRARKQGYTIIEVPIPHYPRTTGRATGANPRVVLRAFGELRTMKQQHWLDRTRDDSV